MSSLCFSLGLMVLCVLIGGFPQSYAEAATKASSSEELVSHQSRSRSGYSSAITREIRKLDDDPVEKLAIPVLLGVRVSDLSKNFGDPRGGGTREHEGLDIMAPEGAFVATPTDAVVVRTGNGESSGITVTTANPGGETFVYMHLSGIADGVKAGKVLKQGDLIGYVGNTGNASGGAPHLHFEIRKDRKALDPYPRITKEFGSEERIAVLTKILIDLQKELARKNN